MSEVPQYAEGSSEERRGERRRRVLLFGRISDATGSQTAECAISNLSVSGAQVRLYVDQSFPSLIYLLNAKTHTAHLSEIVWHGEGRMGLCFRETYDLEKDIPERLNFLKTLLVNTKLRQVELLEAKGFSLAEAIDAIGATRIAYERWRREALIHEETRSTMERLMVENTNLLRTLASERD